MQDCEHRNAVLFCYKFLLEIDFSDCKHNKTTELLLRRFTNNYQNYIIKELIMSLTTTDKSSSKRKNRSEQTGMTQLR